MNEGVSIKENIQEYLTKAARPTQADYIVNALK